MNQETYITASEAALHLQIHARTIRKYIESFEEYICPEFNKRGHYILSKESLKRLLEVKKRLQESNKSMKQIRNELIQEGKIHQARSHTDQTTLDILEKVQIMSNMMQEVLHRNELFEKHFIGLFDSLKNLEHKLVPVIKQSISPNDIHQMFDEIRKKQDQLKIELRNNHLTQKLTSTTRNQTLLPRREKKVRFFGIF